ncbi:MAG: hypothetical protein E7350_04110 [Clostridiales bacterium]|nr:hypothetical protein [Clostridiales bacterium]
MKIKRIVAILLVLAFSLFMVGCENRITTDEAKEQVNALISAVSSGDFDEAEKLLHPSRKTDLEAYFNRAEAVEGVDFQAGIEITKYTGFSSALHETEVDGAEYELEMNVLVSGKALELTVEIVRNDQGFGIYEIDIDD